jgi:hypothetical protein
MDGLEQRLTSLGAALDLPAAPNLVPAVVATLPDRRPRRHRPARRTLAIALLATLAVAGGAMAVPSTRHAILRVLGLRGVQIERVPRIPPLPGGAKLGLGRPVSLAGAVRAVRFTALLPLGPATAYLAGDLAGGRLSLVVGRALIMEFRGTAVPFVFKLLGPGTTARQLRVNGGPGVYISGAPHELLIQELTGEVKTDHFRLSGNVLLWQQGPVTVRIEGTPTLSAALALARSLR